jgi:hypothetical protein
MDIMNVVTTNGKNTIIYQLIENELDTWVIRYYHIKNTVVIGASGELNNIYWFSKNSIYLSNGVSSEKVKVYGKYEMADTFSTSSICTISDGVFKIADATSP